MSEKFIDSHYRTVGKVVSWRVLLTISHIVNAFIATGSIITGLQIAGLAAIINSCLYWIHERLWNLTFWNRFRHTSRNFVEGNTRSIVKIITWRVLITFSNILIPYIITGSWGSAVIFAGLATVVNMVLYWSHERLWNFIKFGRLVQA